MMYKIFQEQETKTRFSDPVIYNEMTSLHLLYFPFKIAFYKQKKKADMY